MSDYQHQYLHQQMNEFLNEEQFKTLCFYLDVDPANLAGDTKEGQIRELLLKLASERRMDKLVVQLKDLQPHANWEIGPPPNVDNPYRGLLAFREEHQADFHGRTPFINQLAKAVQRQPPVPLLGPSGSGKSSVVFAGLVPKLREVGGWHILHFRPEANPLLSLARVIADALEPNQSQHDRLSEAKKIAANYQSPDAAGHVSLAEHLEIIQSQLNDQRILLIIDQFEELFTLTKEVEVRHLFLNQLLTLLPPHPSP